MMTVILQAYSRSSSSRIFVLPFFLYTPSPTFHSVSRFSCNYSRHRVHAGSYEITLAFLVERNDCSFTCHLNRKLRQNLWLDSTLIRRRRRRRRFRATRHLPLWCLFLPLSIGIFRFIAVQWNFFFSIFRPSSRSKFVSPRLTISTVFFFLFIKLLKLNFYRKFPFHSERKVWFSSEIVLCR